MITIYSETHRESCLDGCNEVDAKAYDLKIGEYFQFVEDKARSAGFEFEVLNRLNGLSYWAEPDEEHEWMLYEVPDFWEWFHGSR